MPGAFVTAPHGGTLVLMQFFCGDVRPRWCPSPSSLQSWSFFAGMSKFDLIIWYAMEVFHTANILNDFLSAVNENWSAVFYSNCIVLYHTEIYITSSDETKKNQTLNRFEHGFERYYASANQWESSSKSLPDRMAALMMLQSIGLCNITARDCLGVMQ